MHEPENILNFESLAMTPAEREQMNHLCQRIQEEKDPAIFDKLVQQLLDLLEIKQAKIRLGHEQGAH